MQQIVILNHVLCTVDVYTMDSSENPEYFITEELGWRLSDVSWMSKPDIIPITIHGDD